jgi:hypothetical protein
LELFAKYSIHILYDKIKGIYSPDNITKFKTDAAANLTDLAKDITGDLLYDPTKSNYSLLIKQEFTNKDISTSKDIAYRKDIVTHSNDNPIYSTRTVDCTRYNIKESTKTEGKHLHYISMARDATKIELTNSTGNIRQYTCADGTGIAKGIGRFKPALQRNTEQQKTFPQATGHY